MKVDRRAHAQLAAANSPKLKAALDTTAKMTANDRNVWLTAKYRGDVALQAEFASENSYLAFMEACRTGRARAPA